MNAENPVSPPPLTSPPPPYTHPPHWLWNTCICFSVFSQRGNDDFTRYYLWQQFRCYCGVGFMNSPLQTNLLSVLLIMITCEWRSCDSERRPLLLSWDWDEDFFFVKFRHSSSPDQNAESRWSGSDLSAVVVFLWNSGSCRVWTNDRAERKKSLPRGNVSTLLWGPLSQIYCVFIRSSHRASRSKGVIFPSYTSTFLSTSAQILLWMFIVGAARH